jgi:hypothetical protein
MDGYSKSLRAILIEDEVRRLITEEKPTLAVIVAQTMLELRVEQEAQALVEGFGSDSLGEAALGLLSSMSLSNSRTKKFFEATLGVRFSEEMPEEMKALKVHSELRNRIVHGGETADAEQARFSLRAVDGATWRLHQLVYRRLGMEVALEEDERIRAEERGEIYDED